jgi:hypothetical protein
LKPDQTFEILGSPVVELSVLEPRQGHRLTFPVRALEAPEAVFRFSCSFAGLAAPADTLVRLPVRRIDEQPFRKRALPYNFGPAIQKPEHFYGRSDEMFRVLSTLVKGGRTSFMLRGPRRMGKTSMLYMLKNALERAELLRRFGVPPEWDDALGRCVPVLLDLQAFPSQTDREHVNRVFRTLLSRVCSTLAPRRTAAILAGYNRRCRDFDAPTAVLEALDQVFADRPDTRVVVLLDEYDEVYQPRGRTLDSALRHVVQAEARLTWIIASTLFMFQESKSFGSPWFNILTPVELGCLDHDAAQQLVTEPSAGEGVGWQSDALVSLLDETGRHPAFLQFFCNRIMEYLNQESQSYVVPRTIAVLADQVVQERQTLHNQFEFFWNDVSTLGRLILLAAEELSAPAPGVALRKRVHEQLAAGLGVRIDRAVLPTPSGQPVAWFDHEFGEGLTLAADVVNALTFRRDSRTYAFTVPLFRRWLQNKRREEDLLEMTLAAAAKELEQSA